MINKFKKLSTQALDIEWFRKLYDCFAKVREEAQSFSEKDIDQTIDRAVKAVRKLA
ncbi:hypothetical protein HYT02_03550 [Candidatus Gottesmanbacteria bacterium]|nr:hypothetical protein [Candidatus Gottesmanbacteria bacterium]